MILVYLNGLGFYLFFFLYLQADIPGFYDPCPGVAKSLYIQYRFRDQLHETTVPDEEPIRLPLKSMYND